MLQTGAWKTTVIAEGIGCNAWTFPTDFETAYLTAARAAFWQSFEPWGPHEIREQGLNAQVIVYEGALGASFDGNLDIELLAARA